MKRILVPTDFSEYAYAAAETAARIAKRTGARVYLIHVINILEYGDEEETAKKIFIMKLVRKRMEEMVNQPFFEGVNVVEALSFDLIYENISKQAIKHEIDLIVMGSHGAHGLQELIFGSNAQKILRRSECPVLVVKKLPEKDEVKNLVFVSNFEPEVETAFINVQRFAEIYGAKIHLLKVCTPFEFETSNDSTKKMNELAAATGLKDYTVNMVNAFTFEAGIREFTEATGADLTAISTHGRDGLGHILFGSRTEALVNHEKMPILSVRIRDWDIQCKKS